MFGLRKKQMALPPPPAPMRIPADRVMQLSQQGYSDPEIIRTLREEGYKPSEVDAALKQALKSSAFGPTGFRQKPGLDDELDEPGPARSDLQLPELPWQQRQQRPAEPPAFEPARRSDEPARRPIGGEGWEPRRPLPQEPDEEELPALPTRRPAPPTASRDRIAEVVEAALEEKWDAMQGELESLEHRIKALEDRGPAQPTQDFRELEQKIDSSKQQSAELAAKMEAMERVVKDSLTPMMEAMRSLSDAIRELKQQRT